VSLPPVESTAPVLVGAAPLVLSVVAALVVASDVVSPPSAGAEPSSPHALPSHASNAHRP
jgi:hypothetical protein